MKWRKTLFFKVVMILLLFAIPITTFYTYSYYKGLHIMKNELKERNLNRLSLVRNQIDRNFDNLSILLLSLSGHSSVQELRNIELYNNYQQFRVKSELNDQLSLLKGISSWKADFAVYVPNNGITLKTYGDDKKDVMVASEWEVRTDPATGSSYYIKHIVQPLNSIINHKTPDIIIEVKTPVKNIENYLAQLKLNQYNDPFMYKIDSQSILSSSKNKDKMTEMIKGIPISNHLNKGNVIVNYNDKQYLISYMKLENLDWMIVDYMLVQDVFASLANTRNMFYTFVAIMLLLSLLTAYLLYRNIQFPIKNLIKGIQYIKSGNYSVKIQPNKIQEFEFVISSFNEMTQQLKTLIEEVYQEKIRYQEIHLKQLQFQINPHFLHNCLFIIKNMAKLKQTEAIEAMSLHLGNYYRYMTNIDHKEVTIGEELEFIRNYLDIHKIRSQRFTYEMNVSDEILNLLIPRLLIQPLVENALEHGVRIGNEGIIQISGSKINGKNILIIEDNGKGLTEKEIIELEKQIQLPVSSEDGHGVWNVQQRLAFHFGEGARLNFSTSSLGGLKVEMRWK
ncbi:sensor histidine kinase [Neobacillus vireti]|uniref:sensor histidine kinase n=1 Tax=Neobacillus vireti TaxID=220686 RepID=UPI002FFD8B94